ncbi:hypothetical protein, partial [uncultured Brevundimonas sp.]|uniref:hypothetical protein n=1 Tax=uncultured Brevundimonas sp. TaxID=213418 RepID=UPI0026027E02
MLRLCSKKFASFAASSEFRWGAYAITCSKISIGRRVIVRPSTMLFAFPTGDGGRIVIEDDVLMGSGVHIYTANHEFADPERLIIDQGHRDPGDVFVRRGAWIGANAIVLAGGGGGGGEVQRGPGGARSGGCSWGSWRFACAARPG